MNVVLILDFGNREVFGRGEFTLPPSRALYRFVSGLREKLSEILVIRDDIFKKNSARFRPFQAVLCTSRERHYAVVILWWAHEEQSGREVSFSLNRL